MTSAEYGQHGPAAACAEIPRHGPGGLDHGAREFLPRGRRQQPLDRSDQANRASDTTLPVDDGRGHPRIADRGLLVLHRVPPPADLGQGLAQRRPGRLGPAGQRRQVAVRSELELRARLPPLAGALRSHARARRHAMGWRLPPPGSAPCCRAGTRDAARSLASRTGWRPRPPRSPAGRGLRPTTATWRAARSRPGRHCRAGGRRGQGCTYPCTGPGPRDRASPGCAATRRRSAWPARPARRSRSRPSAVSRTRGRRG